MNLILFIGTAENRYLIDDSQKILNQKKIRKL